MVALAATNVVGVVLFGTVYALAGARRLSQAAFVACLVLVFGLVTALWVRTESRHRALHLVGRLGRALAGLLAAIIVVPAAVLMPLFWLEGILPAEIGLTDQLAPIMAIVLISLVLVMLSNVVGALIVALRGTLGGGA